MTDADNIIYLLAGRGIDGACWRSGEGWANHPGLATAYKTPEGAEGMKAEAMFEFNQAALFDKVGCLVVVPMGQAAFERARDIVYAEMDRDQDEWESSL
jgi:hypothetical protein